jgi:hypothetical protein
MRNPVVCAYPSPSRLHLKAASLLGGEPVKKRRFFLCAKKEAALAI